MRLSIVLAAVLVAMGSLSMQALGADPSPLASIDMAKVARGDRLGKLIGASVVNDENETVGKIDDVVLDDDQPYIVLSVGGFLGVGNKLVLLPYRAVRKTDDRLVMPGATKDALKALPDFPYTSK